MSLEEHEQGEVDGAIAVLDGSDGEGGGQILRLGMSLASILQVPLTIHSIRANRPKPGLRPQHVQCLSVVSQVRTSRCRMHRAI
jgi:RNA 3'-terminal phosphate cyclase